MLAYRDALARHYGGPTGITYAGKAGLTIALAQWAAQHGLVVDCTGVGEMHVAVRAGVPLRRFSSTASTSRPPTWPWRWRWPASSWWTT
ncbi:MAG: hypothetical protein H6644_13920 [Caldilineaceae bacterium]|nr:hypothetical protein [Caldilineaceae bacterium]